ncbi:hypothetical protein EJB05_00934, partial [Eragrostis curvula]
MVGDTSESSWNGPQGCGTIKEPCHIKRTGPTCSIEAQAHKISSLKAMTPTGRFVGTGPERNNHQMMLKSQHTINI